MITREILNSHPIRNLKAELRKLKKSFNFSKLTKDELIDLMMEKKDKFNHIEMYEKPARKPRKKKGDVPKVFITEEPPKVKAEPVPKKIKIVRKKKVEPKPKQFELPKPSVKKFRLDRKEEKEITLEDTLKLYEKKSLDKPVPFKCFTHTYIFLMNAIMNKHKNDCAFVDIDSKGSKKKEVFMFKVRGAGKLYDRNNLFLVRDNEELQKRIALRYLECKKNKKMLVIVLSLQIKGGHANMLVFNYARDEVERFEPHGAKGQHYSDKTNNSINKNLGIFIKGMNRHLDKDLKFIPPSEICPMGQKSFQSYENQNMKTGKARFGNYEVDVKSDNGYCCAWSHLFLDIRLSEPKLSGAELTKKTLERYKPTGDKDWKLLKGFVRFIFNEALEINIKALKQMEGKKIKDYKIEEDDINEYLFYYYGNGKTKNAGKLLAMTEEAEILGIKFLTDAIKK